MNLDEKSLLIAIEKSMINAEELLFDADLLQRNGRMARAYTLYQLATEETGKAMRIYGSIVLGLLSTEKGRKEFVKNFTSHIEKAQSARSLSLLVIEEIRRKDEQLGDKLLDMLMTEFSESKTLNDYKNFSLYTSWIDDSYKTPMEMITNGKVNYIELMSKNRFAVAKAFFQSALQIIDQVKQLAIENPMTEERILEWTEKLLRKGF